MNIRTFWGSADEMGDAIDEAETDAQKLLVRLGPAELVSVTAQSFVDRWPDSSRGDAGHTCFHIITVVFT